MYHIYMYIYIVHVILLFSAVNAHGDLICQICQLYFKLKSCDGSLPPHETAKSQLSCDCPAKRSRVHSQLYPLTCMGTQARVGFYQLRMTFVRVLISNCSAVITLTLQGSAYARLYFRRSVYRATMESNCTQISLQHK